MAAFGHIRNLVSSPWDPAKERKCAGMPEWVYGVRLLGAKMEIPGLVPERRTAEFESSKLCAPPAGGV